MRLEPGSQDYRREDLSNYLCTNDGDYSKMYNYMSKLRADLIKCENSKGKQDAF